MEVDDSLVTFILATYYEVSPTIGSIKSLAGYSDKNFSFIDKNDNNRYVLKIVNKDESQPQLTEVIDEVLDSARDYCLENRDTLLFTTPKLIKTSANKLSTFTNVRHTNGDTVQIAQCNLKLMEHFDGQTVIDYLNSAQYKPEEIFFKLGKICNQLFRFLRTKQHLREQLKEARGDSFVWQMSTCHKIIESNLEKLFPNQPAGDNIQSNQINLINQVLKEYRGSIETKLKQLPEYIIHSDLSNSNILIRRPTLAREEFCLIDFGDLQVGQQCVELAVSMLYNVLEQERQPFDEAIQWIPHWVYKGYQSNPSCCMLDDEDLLLIPTLMRLRLAQSLLNGLLAIRQDPKNTYVMNTNRRGWQLLELLMSHDSKKLADWWKNGPTRK